MSLGLFNCRLIQPAGDQLFFFAGVAVDPIVKTVFSHNKRMPGGVLGLSFGGGYGSPPLAIPALESALGSHPCGSMSLGLFNCRLIQPAGDQLFFFAGVAVDPIVKNS